MKYPKRFREFSIAMIVLLSAINSALFNSLSKSKSTLTTVVGTIVAQGHYHKPSGYHRSATDANTISISGYINFGILDDKKRAYTYLTNNSVVGKQATIMYDPNGYNDQKDLTLHIYMV